MEKKEKRKQKVKRNQNKRGHKYFWIYVILIALAGLSFYCFMFLKDILNQNNVMWTNTLYQAYIQMAWIYIALYAAFIVTLQFRYMDERKYRQEKKQLDKVIIEKNQVIEKLNNEMIKNKIYDTVTHTWSEEYLRKYVHQLCEKQVRKFSFVKIQCLTDEAIETLLLHANYVLGNNTITFKIKDNEYIFLFINADMTDVRNEMDYIIPQNTKNLLSFTCDGYWDKEEDIIKNLQLGDKANG